MPRTILVAVDPEPSLGATVRFAVRLARHEPAHLILARASDPAGLVRRGHNRFTAEAEGLAQLEGEDVRSLDAGAEQALAAHADFERVQLEGDRARVLLDYALSRGADAIVVGKEEAARVVRGSSLPVFVVPPKTPAEDEGTESGPMFRHVLVAYDHSDPSDAALTAAARICAQYGARCTLCHVLDERDLREAASVYGYDAEAIAEEDRAEAAALLRTASDRQSELAGITTEWRVAEGEPAATLRAIAERDGADLLVMGTHGRRGLRRLLLGSVAEAVTRESPVPVLIVRAQASLADRATVLNEPARTP